MIDRQPLTPEEVQLLLSKGRSMPRDRQQAGWVQEVGKRTKKWMGFYYVYAAQADGTERRLRRKKVLGLKSKMKKWEAEKELQDLIDKGAGGELKPSPNQTLAWFWENRFRPIKEAEWKDSSKPKTIRFVRNYILNAKVAGEKSGRTFGEMALGEIDRFTIQTHLNGLAENFSKSVVTKFRVYMKSMFDEALEQDFIQKNPARKLSLPKTKATCGRVLSEEEIVELLGVLDGRDRLIIRMFLVLGLRPGEMFALRRDDRIHPSQIRIDESVSEELDCGDKLVAPKTEASTSYVWLPRSIETELDFWLDGQEDKRPEAFMFPSKVGSPLNLNNFLNRNIKPAATLALNRVLQEGRIAPPGFLARINHQAFRRTVATQMQKTGTVKDVQAHLRHATPAMTIGVYMKEIPASVREAVEHLDQKLLAATDLRDKGRVH
jgi:integrase